MRFPLVTLSHYDEMKAELRAQIAESREECHRWQDLFAEKVTGRRIWHEPEPESESSVQQAPPANETPMARAVRVLTASGKRADARSITRFIEQERAQQYASDHEIVAPEAPEDMKEAVEAGRAAASER